MLFSRAVRYRRHSLLNSTNNAAAVQSSPSSSSAAPPSPRRDDERPPRGLAAGVLFAGEALPEFLVELCTHTRILYAHSLCCMRAARVRSAACALLRLRRYALRAFALLRLRRCAHLLGCMRAARIRFAQAACVLRAFALVHAHNVQYM